MDIFTLIRNFFNESNRGVWSKREILLALDTLRHKYMNETTKKLQEEISRDIKQNREESKL